MRKIGATLNSGMRAVTVTIPLEHVEVIVRDIENLMDMHETPGVNETDTPIADLCAKLGPFVGEGFGPTRSVFGRRD